MTYFLLRDYYILPTKDTTFEPLGSIVAAKKELHSSLWVTIHGCHDVPLQWCGLVARPANPDPSTQHSRTLVPRVLLIAFWTTRDLKYWVLGLSGKRPHGLLLDNMWDDCGPPRLVLKTGVLHGPEGPTMWVLAGATWTPQRYAQESPKTSRSSPRGHDFANFWGPGKVS